MKTSFRALIASLVLASAASLFAAETKISPPDGASVVIPRAKQYDITSKINGRTYRVFVSTPFRAEEGKKYPVIYLLDGNWYFGPASINATESSVPAIVVGIGYPTDDNRELGSRRGFELTISRETADKDDTVHGGGGAFLRFLSEEVKPFIASHYAVDPARQVLYGKSLGGLMVLHQLFTDPTAYSTYIAASPAISRNDREVLKGEAAFSRRVQAGELNLRILITVGGTETTGPMIPNASELATRLAALNPEKVKVTYNVIPDENHVLVSLASIGRALGYIQKP
ncbi:MAG: alpha/beta hydrolase-fold protein [Opitutaceae bacterium]